MIPYKLILNGNNQIYLGLLHSMYILCLIFVHYLFCSAIGMGLIVSVVGQYCDPAMVTLGHPWNTCCCNASQKDMEIG